MEPRPEGQRYNSLDVVSTTWGEAGRKFQPRSISLDFPEHHRYLAPAWHAAPAQAVAAVSILCAIAPYPLITILSHGRGLTFTTVV
ncbi:hypothetical protein QC762_0086600 [Podospora pseudocomata]|uniref:Uncharacterized protein n=2 Tax=Podospora TaxID=5144 RepID=A0ABR0GDF8_9PEZI|nr:hypothetical protein QC761_0085300 [Podospora bellae-mahoneyi]KAK4653728.1 hypothetical protein QC762_0086600 [Podospora pseudocomata]